MAARANAPDVAVLDIEMPGIDGIAAAEVLRREVPSCRVLIVTTFGRPGYLRRAMESGASGFIVKDAPAKRLADAIRRVHAGLRVVDPELAAESLAVGENPLTPARRTSCVRRGTARALPRSPAGCFWVTARSATTCPVPSARPAAATGLRRST